MSVHSGVVPTTQFAFRKGLGITFFGACPIHYRMHWRVDKRLELGRLTSTQPLIGPTIMEFSIGSVVGILGSILLVLT